MNHDRALKHPSDATAGMRKRYVIIVASVVPVAALFALLGWAVAQSGGNLLQLLPLTGESPFPTGQTSPAGEPAAR